jgi:NCAIR mutase (PurE)-related protein
MSNGSDAPMSLTRDALRALLEEVRGGMQVEVALERLAVLPYELLGHTRVDHHRALRRGVPEVIYGAGKTADQVSDIMRSILARSPLALATRVDAATGEAVRRQVPEAEYYPQARMLVADREPLEQVGNVAVVTAGTSDMHVAEEAALTAATLGNHVTRVYDVGVAGLNRLIGAIPDVRAARTVVVVAGMEGALPSVVAGLVAVPVIAVPTSVGYGANFGGLAPLLGMLNSCSTGVAVVNIDNGFGAGALASMINRGTPE